MSGRLCELPLQEHEEAEDGGARRQAKMWQPPATHPPTAGQFSLVFLVAQGREAQEGWGGKAVNVGI